MSNYHNSCLGWNHKEPKNNKETFGSTGNIWYFEQSQINYKIVTVKKEVSSLKCSNLSFPIYTLFSLSTDFQEKLKKTFASYSRMILLCSIQSRTHQNKSRNKSLHTCRRHSILLEVDKASSSNELYDLIFRGLKPNKYLCVWSFPHVWSTFGKHF